LNSLAARWAYATILLWSPPFSILRTFTSTPVVIYLDIAAAYAFHIAEAQAYLDGNKRTAVGAALTFLNSNGVSTSADSMPIYDVMIAIAERRAGKPELAEVLRRLFA
jgi:prophage maintenance system killer protein